jgi:thiamine biosynthesis lipoprotein
MVERMLSKLALLSKIMLLSVFSCLPILATAAWYTEQQGIMGTNIQVEVWAEEPQLGNDAIAAVMAEMERINQLMSPYIDSSELSLLNRQAGAVSTQISQEMYDLLHTAVEISRETDGAFDITFASVGFLYDYRRQQKPAEEQIAALLEAVNYRHLQFDDSRHAIKFLNDKVKIDLGGIAKGYAVDNSLHILKGLGIQHALVTAGGDTGLLGDRRGRPWMVGIRDPRSRDKQAVVLPLENIALSTSGDYERYFEQDGQRFHHILSPKSGHSVYEVQSVSILGPQSTLTDALSTAVFVLGLQLGMDLVNQTPGYEAIIMDNQRRLHYSKGLIP